MAAKEKNNTGRRLNHVFQTMSPSDDEEMEFEEFMDCQPEASIFYTTAAPNKVLPVKAAKLALALFYKHMEKKKEKDPARYMRKCRMKCELEAHPFGSL